MYKRQERNIERSLSNPGQFFNRFHQFFIVDAVVIVGVVIVIIKNLSFTLSSAALCDLFYLYIFFYHRLLGFRVKVHPEC